MDQIEDMFTRWLKLRTWMQLFMWMEFNEMYSCDCTKAIDHMDEIAFINESDHSLYGQQNPSGVPFIGTN